MVASIRMLIGDDPGLARSLRAHRMRKLGIRSAMGGVDPTALRKKVVCALSEKETR